MWIHRSTDACKNQLNKSNKIKLVIGFIDHQSFKIKQKYYSMAQKAVFMFVMVQKMNEITVRIPMLQLNINQSNQN